MIEEMLQTHFIDRIAQTFRDPPKDTDWARDLAAKLGPVHLTPEAMERAADGLIVTGGKAFPQFAKCYNALKSVAGQSEAKTLPGGKVFVVRGSPAWEALTSASGNGRRRSYPIGHNEAGEAGWWIDRQTVLATGAIYSAVERKQPLNPSDLVRRATVASRFIVQKRAKTPAAHLSEPPTPSAAPVSVSSSLARALSQDARSAA